MHLIWPIGLHTKPIRLHIARKKRLTGISGNTFTQVLLNIFILLMLCQLCTVLARQFAVQFSRLTWGLLQWHIVVVEMVFFLFSQCMVRTRWSLLLCYCVCFDFIHMNRTTMLPPPPLLSSSLTLFAYTTNWMKKLNTNTAQVIRLPQNKRSHTHTHMHTCTLMRLRPGK